MTTDHDDYGQRRAAHEVQPGWQVLVNDEDDFDVWRTVSEVSQGEDPWMGRRMKYFLFTDGSQTSCGFDAHVMCRTVAEAKRAAKADAR